jgi:hypothetical protein
MSPQPDPIGEIYLELARESADLAAAATVQYWTDVCGAQAPLSIIAQRELAIAGSARAAALARMSVWQEISARLASGLRAEA